MDVPYDMERWVVFRLTIKCSKVSLLYFTLLSFPIYPQYHHLIFSFWFCNIKAILHVFLSHCHQAWIKCSFVLFSGPLSQPRAALRCKGMTTVGIAFFFKKINSFFSFGSQTLGVSCSNTYCIAKDK